MGLKEQLESAGYDTSNLNENDLITKLDQAGYDTSSLTKSQTAEQAYAEPGLQDVSPTLFTKNEFEKSGPDQIAEALAPTVGPKLAAAAGTTFRMIPEIVPLLIGVKGGAIKETEQALKATGVAAKEGVTAIGEAGSAVKSAVKAGVNAIKKTGEQQVATVSEKIAELPIKQTSIRESAEGLRKAAKIGIQKSEEKIGIGMTQLGEIPRTIIDNPKKLSQFTQMVNRLANKGPEYLTDATDIKNLQRIRKTVQAGLKVVKDDASRVMLSRANNVLGEAIARKEPEIGEALSKYKDIERVISELPAKFKKEKQMLGLALTKAKNLATSQESIRKGLLYTGGTAAALLLGKKVIGQ